MRSINTSMVLVLVGALLGGCGGGKKKPGASHPATLAEMFAAPTQVVTMPRPLGAVRLGMAIDDVHAAAPVLGGMNIYSPPKLPGVKVMLITMGERRLNDVIIELPADAVTTLEKSWGPPQRRQPASGGTGEVMLWSNAEQSLEALWMPTPGQPSGSLDIGKLGTLSQLIPPAP